MARQLRRAGRRTPAGMIPRQMHEPTEAATVAAAGEPLDVTILFPCLNEAEAIGGCVQRARAALDGGALRGEVLVVDNGSTDRSAEIARAHGARVVSEPRRGYGRAYLRGFTEARGEVVVMLDADGTYPVEMTGTFVAWVRDEGYDLVVGDRFGGLMEADAMPFLNRYLGNPVLSGMTRLLYRVWLHDIHCGMRAIRRDAIGSLALQTPGMEFATEMIVKAIDRDLRVKEVPIPYRRRTGESKLQRFRDGLRHMEYMLVFSPAPVFLLPGAALFALGLAIQTALVSGPTHILIRTWDSHTNLAGLAASLLGITLVVLGLVCCALARSVRMRFRHSLVSRWVAALGDGPVRVAGALLALGGALAWATIFARWAAAGFGRLSSLPALSLATTLLASGALMLAAAFLVNAISLRTDPEP